jgi:hypothetical protein
MRIVRRPSTEARAPGKSRPAEAAFVAVASGRGPDNAFEAGIMEVNPAVLSWRDRVRVASECIRDRLDGLLGFHAVTGRV